MAPRVGEHLAWLGPREDDVHDGKDSDQVVTPVEGVRQSMELKGVEPRVGEDDFQGAPRRWITVERCPDILSN